MYAALRPVVGVLEGDSLISSAGTIAREAGQLSSKTLGRMTKPTLAASFLFLSSSSCRHGPSSWKNFTQKSGLPFFSTKNGHLVQHRLTVLYLYIEDFQILTEIDLDAGFLLIFHGPGCSVLPQRMTHPERLSDPERTSHPERLRVTPGLLAFWIWL